METTTTARPTNDRPAGHDWEEAGDAWGSRARDWACLFEHYAMDVLTAVLPKIGVTEGTSLLDVACGSGLAVRLARGTGAEVAGIDAAASLIDIARERTPDADLRVGDMFELPWADESFENVVSINGIWGGCEGALAEMHRVVRPGGHVAISFWGTGHLDLKPCFRAFAAHAPDDHREGMRRTNGIARPGVAEEMLRGAGFEVIESGGRVSTVEWPDEDTAWRALASLGPAVPALERVGAEFLRPIVLEALAEVRDPFGTYRFRNDHRFVVARRPG
ncbi:MAG: class I SAM-dependent methyltransferase [Actinobacteria bacterium]|nr:class I SAM-dependent methyltransferase [Actinomycetota bacterium]